MLELVSTMNRKFNKIQNIFFLFFAKFSQLNVWCWRFALYFFSLFVYLCVSLLIRSNGEFVLVYIETYVIVRLGCIIKILVFPLYREQTLYSGWMFVKLVLCLDYTTGDAGRVKIVFPFYPSIFSYYFLITSSYWSDCEVRLMFGLYYGGRWQS